MSSPRGRIEDSLGKLLGLLLDGDETLEVDGDGNGDCGGESAVERQRAEEITGRNDIHEEGSTLRSHGKAYHVGMIRSALEKVCLHCRRGEGVSRRNRGGSDHAGCILILIDYDTVVSGMQRVGKIRSSVVCCILYSIIQGMKYPFEAIIDYLASEESCRINSTYK